MGSKLCGRKSQLSSVVATKYLANALAVAPGPRGWTGKCRRDPSPVAWPGQAGLDCPPNYRTPDSANLDRKSLTISSATFLARAKSVGGREMAATLAWPPPPYRSQMLARLAVLGVAFHGLLPTPILIALESGLRPRCKPPLETNNKE